MVRRITEAARLPEARYRRHNRAASSLEDGLRQEAERMLEAVVQCREKFLGVPADSKEG